MTAAERGTACPLCGQQHDAGGPCDPAARIGEVLGDKYRVTRFIGQGGMGSVYEAQHTVVGRRFAVKLLHATLARRADLVARFRREAQAAGSLESENIASVVDFGHAGDGLPYLVMELLSGEDLGRLLGRVGPLPVARAVDIVVQTCRGLEAAHAAGIVHRDLKPENLFVCQRGDGRDLVKILDFGIAKLGAGSPDAALASVTRTGSTLGTPFYMPPEQARGEKELDHRADIYALGVILFEILSGQKPHPGDSYNAILYDILMRPAASLDACRPGLPAGLSSVVHRALASRPEARQASATELARALAPFAGGATATAPAQSRVELRAAPAATARARAASTVPSDPSPGGTLAPIEARQPQRSPRSRRVALAAAGALACVAGAGFVAWVARAGGPRGAVSAAATSPGVPPAPAAPRASSGSPMPPEPPVAHAVPAAPPAPEPPPRPLAPAPAVDERPPPSAPPGARRSQKHASSRARRAAVAPTAAAPATSVAPPATPGRQPPPTEPAPAPATPHRPVFDRSNPYQ